MQDGTQFVACGVADALPTVDTGAAVSAHEANDLEVHGAYDMSIGFGFGLDQSVTAGMNYKF